MRLQDTICELSAYYLCLFLFLSKKTSLLSLQHTTKPIKKFHEALANVNLREKEVWKKTKEHCFSQFFWEPSDTTVFSDVFQLI